MLLLSIYSFYTFVFYIFGFVVNKVLFKNVLRFSHKLAAYQAPVWSGFCQIVCSKSKSEIKMNHVFLKREKLCNAKISVELYAKFQARRKHEVNIIEFLNF